MSKIDAYIDAWIFWFYAVLCGINLSFAVINESSNSLWAALTCFIVQIGFLGRKRNYERVLDN